MRRCFRNARFSRRSAPTGYPVPSMAKPIRCRPSAHGSSDLLYCWNKIAIPSSGGPGPGCLQTSPSGDHPRGQRRNEPVSKMDLHTCLYPGGPSTPRNSSPLDRQQKYPGNTRHRLAARREAVARGSITWTNPDHRIEVALGGDPSHHSPVLSDPADADTGALASIGTEVLLLEDG